MQGLPHGVCEDSDIGGARQRVHDLPEVRQQECATGIHGFLPGYLKEERMNHFGIESKRVHWLCSIGRRRYLRFLASSKCLQYRPERPRASDTQKAGTCD